MKTTNLRCTFIINRYSFFLLLIYKRSMVEKYTAGHIITKFFLIATSTDLFNGTLFFSGSFITQNVYTDREGEREEEEKKKNSNFCSMDDLGGASGSGGDLGGGISGDGDSRLTS